jgi:hypothetical protein
MEVMVGIFEDVTDAKSAKKFIFALFASDLGFHLDDCAIDCLEHTGLPLHALETIQRNVNKCFDYLDDPFETCYEAMSALDPEGNKSTSQHCNAGE